jgi:hypothetical protein
MKKLIIPGLLLLLTCSYPAFATALPASTPLQAPTMNIEGTANSILSKLDKSLLLTDKQKPRLLTIITNFLRQKTALQPLQQSNGKAYNTKMNSMQNGLHTKLKSLLTPSQYNTYLQLKPKNYDVTDVLSHMFY